MPDTLAFAKVARADARACPGEFHVGSYVRKAKNLRAQLRGPEMVMSEAAQLNSAPPNCAQMIFLLEL
jgi:hypothetical protein